MSSFSSEKIIIAENQRGEGGPFPLCVHSKEDSNYVFPKIKLRSFCSQFPFHTSVSEFYTSISQDRSTYFTAAKQADLWWE
jgi:hypothetical protein